MSVDYYVIIGGHKFSGYQDVANIQKLEQWLEQQYSADLGWEYPLLKCLTPESESFCLWHCTYLNNLAMHDFIEEFGKYQWSDWAFLMISANDEPFTLIRVDQSHRGIITRTEGLTTTFANPPRCANVEYKH